MNTSYTLPTNAYLHFAHAYGFQDPNNDGGVLEYSTNGGTSWSDAGGLFDQNGYKGPIASGTGNPLAGRSGFIGDSHGYYSSRLNLNSLAGQSVRFRWRMGLDSSTYDWGWWLDDVRIYTCSGTPPPCYSLTTNVSPSGGGSVSANPAPNCGSQYTAETIVTLTANANSGYVLDHWSGDASGSSKTTTVTMTGAKSVTANFAATNWMIKASMSVARSRAAVAAVNGKVYVIGGESAAAGFQPIQGDNFLRESVTLNAWEKTTEEYDPAANSWASKATKPTGVSNIGAGVINGKIYVPGGYYVSGSSSYATSVVEVYDPATNSWSTVAPLPTAQYAHAVTAVNNKLYVMGGNSLSSGYLNTCYVFDPSANSWSTCAPMTYARSHAGAGVVNGKIYVVGGYNGSTLDLNYVEEYNPITNTWSIVAPLGTARGGPGVVGVGNYLYVCGGGWSTYLRSCEKYDPAANSWSAFDRMNIGRRTFGLVEADGKLYAEAGYNGSYSAANEEYSLGGPIFLPLIQR
jgi:N-acetylneuraminic acid mutarotase